jgi:penicillin V acylase-like amidase (Ntn superfamily)
MLQPSFRLIVLLLSTIFSMVYSDITTACTRVLRVDKDNAVMVGRNMDWMTDMQTVLIVYPKGTPRVGDLNDNPLMWSAKYGTIVAAVFGDVSTDGMNEAGLSAHILWLDKSDYGQSEPSQPSLSVVMWMQYYLDNFKSVAEAVLFSETQPLQVVPFYHPATKRWLNLHLILDDVSGDSAILEFTDGKLHIYHNRDYITTTNDPSYDKQLQNLKQYKVFGGDKPLPGTNDPADRFVRATYYTLNLPNAESTQDELGAVMSVINNAAQPFTKGTSEKPHMSKTLWHTIADLTHKIYYFQSTTNHNLVSASLDKFNLKAGAPIMFLDLPNHPEYNGDVTTKFQSLD